MDNNNTNTVLSNKEIILVTAYELEKQLRELFLSKSAADKMQSVITYIEKISN